MFDFEVIFEVGDAVELVVVGAALRDDGQHVLGQGRRARRVVAPAQLVVELVEGGDHQRADPDDEVGGDEVHHHEVGQPAAVVDVQPRVGDHHGRLEVGGMSCMLFRLSN